MQGKSGPDVSTDVNNGSSYWDTARLLEGISVLWFEMKAEERLESRILQMHLHIWAFLINLYSEGKYNHQTQNTRSTEPNFSAIGVKEQKESDKLCTLLSCLIKHLN